MAIEQAPMKVDQLRVQCQSTFIFNRSMKLVHTFTVSAENQMVLAALREHLPDGPSWSAVKKILRARRVAIGGVVCVDEAGSWPTAT